MIPDLSWQDSGLCRETDPELFFSEGLSRPGWERQVIQVYCRQCPVIVECREYAVSHPDPQYGVWGGLSEREIGSLRAQRGVTVGFAARLKQRSKNAEVA